MPVLIFLSYLILLDVLTVVISDGGDGDGVNERVVRLDGLDGETLSVKWIRGNNGTVDTSDDPNSGGFLQLHSVTLDSSRDAVWLADRGNSRLVKLDATTGAFLGEWPCINSTNGHGPNSVRYASSSDSIIGTVGKPVSADDASVLWALDAAAASNDCNFKAGPVVLNGTNNAHEIVIDQKTGAVYIAEEDIVFGQVRTFPWSCN